MDSGQRFSQKKLMRERALDMAIPAIIGIANANGSVDSIRVETGGYPERMAAILCDAYTDEPQVRALVSDGDRIWIGDTISNADVIRGTKVTHSADRQEFEQLYGQAGCTYLFEHGAWMFVHSRCEKYGKLPVALNGYLPDWER